MTEEAAKTLLQVILYILLDSQSRVVSSLRKGKKVLIFSRSKDIYDQKFSTKQAAVKAGSDCDSLFALRKQQPSKHIYESGKPNSKGMMMISEKNTYRYSDGRKAAAAFNASTTSAVL